jgi:hypothetical protein
MFAATISFIRRTSRHIADEHGDTEDSRMMVPTAIAATGMWLVMLAGPLTSVFGEPAPIVAPRVEAVVSLNNEALEIATLRETGELEPERPID